jgi:single-strand DNA-binding protein
MANLNKVMLIGRLTNEPEERVFTNGGKVAKFRFAVNNRKKNNATGQWEDDPVFLDVDAFNRGEFGKQADLVMQYLRKGHQVFIEGHLKLEQWKSKEGENRSRLVVVCDNFQFLEPRSDGMGDGSRAPRASSAPAPRQPAGVSPPSGGYDEPEPPMDEPQGNDDIPF